MPIVQDIPKRRTRVVRAGLVYAAVVLAIGIAAGSRPNNLLVWVFACLLAALVASGIVSGWMLMPLRAVRIEPRRGRVGEPLLVRYEIRNISRLFPAFDLHVVERDVSAATERGVKERGAKERGAKQRGATPASSLLPAGEAWILHVGPSDRVHAEAVFRPTQRGTARLSRFEVRSTFPFDLLQKTLIFTQSAEVLIHPEIRALRGDVLQRVTAGGIGGQRISGEAGGSDDFFGVREYRPGDSVRQIAWKRLAGTGKLASIERSRSVPPRVRVLLDLSRATSALRVGEGEDARTLEEDAIVLAASFLALADRLGYEYALSIAGMPSPPVALRRGHFHREKLMSLLAAIDLERPRTAGNGLAASDERSTVIVIHPDRAETSIAPQNAWHFTARQLAQLTEPAGRATVDAGAREEGAAA
ncbi:MAG: DUF58 domain-containing protein [bacterium]